MSNYIAHIKNEVKSYESTIFATFLYPIGIKADATNNQLLDSLISMFLSYPKESIALFDKSFNETENPLRQILLTLSNDSPYCKEITPIIKGLVLTNLKDIYSAMRSTVDMLELKNDKLAFFTIDASDLPTCATDNVSNKYLQAFLSALTTKDETINSRLNLYLVKYIAMTYQSEIGDHLESSIEWLIKGVVDSDNDNEDEPIDIDNICYDIGEYFIASFRKVDIVDKDGIDTCFRSLINFSELITVNNAVKASLLLFMDDAKRSLQSSLPQ